MHEEQSPFIFSGLDKRACDARSLAKRARRRECDDRFILIHHGVLPDGAGRLGPGWLVA